MMKNPQEKIQEIVDECSKRSYIFRGESKEHEKISTGLYRQYCQSDGSNTPINSEHFFVFDVEKDVVEKAKRHVHPAAPNIEVLTELQHYGGKTALLDFTENIHIALFFACDGDFDEDGRVVFLATSKLSEKTDIDYQSLNENREQNIDTLISPTGKSPRVIFQSSVFVHVPKGYLEEDSYKIIKIEKNIKKPLLKYLNKHFNIKEDTIYNDIQGFIKNQKDYSNAYIEFYRGHSNHQDGIFEEAIKNYSKAIELNPELIEAYTNRGTAKNDLGQYDEAMKDYDKAIELNPQFSGAYNNRGNAHFALGNHREAIKDYDKAIELNPQYTETYNNRGAANATLDQYDKAMKDYDKAIELNPQYDEAYYNRGVAKNYLSQYEEAIKDYDGAIKINPQHAEAYNNRGAANAALDQYDEAMKDYDKAIALNPQYDEAYYNRGLSKHKSEEHQEAIEDYDRVIEINPQFAKVYNNRGVANATLDQYDEAMKDYDKAIELNPQYDEAYYNRGNTNVNLGQHEEAIQDYTKAKKLYEKEGNTEMAEKCEPQITHIKKLIADNDNKNN